MAADLIWVRKGKAHYHKPGIVVVGFGGNGDHGYKKWSHQLLQASDFMVFVNGEGPQARYIAASETEQQLGYDSFTGTEVEHNVLIAAQTWKHLEPKVGRAVG